MSNITALLKQLEEGAAQVAANPEEWKNWLSFMGQFHQYSFTNSLLIMCQKPDATHVAGYRRWQDLRRQVRKGERGIRIMAPCVVKKGDDDHLFFRCVSVFDVSQTDGEPLEEHATDEMLQKQNADNLYQKVHALALQKGFIVGEDTIRSFVDPTIAGYISGESIILETTSSTAMKAKTLIHEVAHGMLDHQHSKLPREIKELEAESVAYVTCAALGLDTSSYSFQYVAVWSRLDKDALAKAFKDSMRAIQETAKSILQAIEEPVLMLA